jgi:hypothetical protein
MMTKGLPKASKLAAAAGDFALTTFYEYMIASLHSRMMRLQARQIHPLQKQQQAGYGAFGRRPWQGVTQW